MEKNIKYFLLTFVFLILVFFYCGTSMDCIEPGEYGISYNKFTKSIGKEVYSSGRYIGNPFKYFLTYPANGITIEFSSSKLATSGPLQTRTGEGGGGTGSASFQYKIIKEEIPNGYNLANVNYHATFVRISRDVILKVGGLFNATNYWTDRLVIAAAMREAIDIELRKAHGRCINLQLLKIDLPTSYEDSIVLTQVEVQKTNMRKFEQQAEGIRQNSSVIISEGEQIIKVTSATGTAEAYRLKAFAGAIALNSTISAETETYKLGKQSLKLKPEELTEYAFGNSVISQTKAKVIFDFQNAIIGFSSSNTPVKD